MESFTLTLGMAAMMVCGTAAADWESWTGVERMGKYKLQSGIIENKDISGLAFMGRTHGLIGSDEERQLYSVAVSREDQELRVLGSVSLPGTSSDEIDIEAIAQDGGYYYITGSHGLAKKSGENQRNRFRIFRLAADPETGVPLSSRGAPERGALAEGSLSTLLRQNAVLGPYFEKPLQQKGLNVEGLAARDGRLYVGFRNPNLDGDAFVLEFAAAELFEGGAVSDFRLHRLSLGAGLGIRALEWTSECLLVLAGNAGSETSDTFTSTVDYIEDRDFELFAWEPKSAALKRLGVLPEPEGKAETLAVLDESDGGVDVLVLFDGPKNGKPTVYRVR